MYKPYWSLGLISPRIDTLFLSRLLHMFFQIVVITVLFFLACAPKQMTLDEAIQTSISMRGQSFVPPPRSTDDILDVIARESKKDALAAKEWFELSKAEIPANANKSELIELYKKRGMAAFVICSFEKSRDDFQKVYELAGPEKVENSVLSLLAGSEQNVGNFEKAIALFNFLKERNPLAVSSYSTLAHIFARAGYFEKADSVRNEGLAHFGNEQNKLRGLGEFFKARLEYVVLNMRAKYQEAEPFIRKAIVEASDTRPPRPELVHIEKIRLIKNLIDQNRLVEAELEARKEIAHSINFFGLESVHSIAAKTIFAEVLLAQGRLIDAEKVSKATLQAYEQSDIFNNSEFFLRSKNTLGEILVAKADYSGAIKQFDFFLGMKDSNRYIYDMFYRNNKNVILALVMIGRVTEAMELIESAYQNSEVLLGKSHPQSAELLAMRGMVYNSSNNLEYAYRDFAESIPLIAKSKTYTENRLSNHRFMVILESFLSLLSKIRGSLVESNLSISASVKAFEVSTLLSDSAVQTAVFASTARMTIKDLGLKELARTEQDVQQQIKAYQNLIQNLLSRPSDEIDRQAINNVKEMLDNLSRARDIIIAEIERRFPDYANLANYRQPSLGNVQGRLSREEIMISICSAENNTYVFTVSPTGPIEMTVVQVTKKDLEKLVSELKKSLSTGSEKLGNLSLYDFGKAYELYALLLKPTEEMWKNSKHMILSVSGPLGQLPFSIISTEPFQLKNEKEVLFSNYREAPWLIKKISVNTVPSVSSFVALRDRPKSVDAKELFAGFGDPFFNKTQMAQAINEKKLYSTRKINKNSKIEIRGIRLTKEGTLDNKKLLSCKVETLERLPDTADELLSIAETLGANPVKDVYLGRQASEKQVKSMDLSDRRVVAFASHALVPYDLDGLDQPAIALSAPSVTGDEDDGLLTMAEILDLKLNADWVVLSACNTGAAEGAGAEAVSGLGRAFFYAGTRAVLVSMWPVETSSAKKLTTSIFRHQKENPGLSKAQAHQMAMLELIDGPGMIDEDGRIIASYAHPFFWAPFVIVGESGTPSLN